MKYINENIHSFLYILVTLFIYSTNLNSQGLMWLKQIHGTDIDNDDSKIIQAVDGSIYTLTKTMVMKFDSKGNELWRKSLSTTENRYRDIAIDSNLNIYIAGASGDCFLKKYDKNFNFKWEKRFSDHYYSTRYSKCMAIDSEGYIYLTGEKWIKHTETDAWISKYDSSGKRIWWKSYNFNDWNRIRISSIAVTNSGNVAITGESGFVETDAYIAMVDNNGNMLFSKLYSSPGINNHARGFSISADKNSNLYVIGCTEHPIAGDYVATTWFAKYNKNGDQIWEKTFFKNRSYDQEKLVVTSDDSVFISENFYSPAKCYLASYTDAGNKNWEYQYGGMYISNFIINDIGNILFLGKTGNQVCIGEFGEKSSIIMDDKKDMRDNLHTYILYQNYPNPFNLATKIKFHLYRSSFITFQIYNILGKKIEAPIEGFRSAGEYEILWQPHESISGIYFYRLQVDDFSETKKLIIQK